MKLNPLASPRAVIFDLDGTLVDTVEQRIGAWLGVFREEGIPANREQLAPLIGSDGKYLARHVAGDAGMELDEERAERIDRRSGEIFNGLNAHPRPLPGVRETLGWLSGRGIEWAIATSSRRQQVDTSVKALGLPRDPPIVDGSHVEHAKPAPDLLLNAARELDMDPRDCWYVGDSTWDVRAALAAGMTPICVTTGTAPPAELEAAGAAAVLDSLERLPALVSEALRLPN